MASSLGDKGRSFIHSGVEVHVLHGDITSLHVDVMVNAANHYLRHAGGVSAAIAQKGGEVVQRESRDFIARNRSLPLGGICVTNAGSLPCSEVIHVVGPREKDHRSDRERLAAHLNRAFDNVFQYAIQNHFKSLSLPGISAGASGVAHSVVAHCTIQSIKNCCLKKKSSLKLIHLVDQDVNMVISWTQQLERDGIFVEADKTEAKSRSRFLPRLDRHTTLPKLSTETNFPVKNTPTKDTDPYCCICMSPAENPKTLDKCHHTFCTECIDRGFKVKPACPVCGEIYGRVTGTQPKDGTMDHTVDKKTSLPGYEGYGTIVIDYRFPNGIQTAEHGNPGQSYSGTSREAYLPDNKEGKKVLELLKQAFKNRLIFTVGVSRTTGRQDTVTWNDIHHKTSVYGGPERFGYPDPTYLTRVRDELAAKGIK